MKITITGGTGFIGTNLCQRLISLGHEVISIDNYSSGKKSNHIPNVKYINSDCRHISKLVHGVDLVFH